MTSSPTIYHGATVFTGVASDAPRESFACRDGLIIAAGDLDIVRAAAGNEAVEVDLGGSVVTPGIIEGHAHMLMLGETLSKVPLRDAETVAEVQHRLAAARAASPDAKVLLGSGWRFDIFDEGERPNAAQIEAAVADVPVVLDANDLHSVWVNTAALNAMGITRETPDPVGGEIVRDSAGNATGFLLETAAVSFAWRYLESLRGEEDEDRYLDAAFTAYLESGVTGATEMSFGHAELAAYRRRLARDGRLPFPITAHWMLTATGDTAQDLAQIEEVIEVRDSLRADHGTDWLSIVGVKFVLDGVIDACTAAMQEPFVNGSHPAPIWNRKHAIPVAVAADAAGLQLALHAIGDEASTIALDIVQACMTENGPRSDRRARVEHLESVADETIARMAALGVTASVQPVHCDPAILDNWQAVLGGERAESGFPWHSFRAAGVPLVLGTDAPTAPHYAPDNLFIALTAESALDASRSSYHPERVFTPAQALESLTSAAATATGKGETLGRIATGHRANITVWGVDPLHGTPRDLVGSAATLTLVDGVVMHDTRDAASRL
ncbi:MAG: amidohydrolase [Microbacteriaceae bacterium]